MPLISARAFVAYERVIPTYITFIQIFFKIRNISLADKDKKRATIYVFSLVV